MTCIYSKLTPQRAIGKIADSTGQVNFRVSSELSGAVKDQGFRVSLPPDGFSHPYRLVICGTVSEAENGSKIEFRHVKPWLPSTLIAIVFFSLVSGFWGEWIPVVAITAGLIFIGAVSLSARKRESLKLTETLKKIVQ